MLPAKIEQKLRIELLSRILDPDRSDSDRRIFDAARSVSSDGRIYFLIGRTPEQYEDFFVILVDDREVISFELGRDSSSSEPVDADRWSLQTHRRQLRGGRNVEEFRVALDIVREKLEEFDTLGSALESTAPKDRQAP